MRPVDDETSVLVQGSGQTGRWNNREVRVQSPSCFEATYHGLCVGALVGLFGIGVASCFFAADNVSEVGRNMYILTGVVAVAAIFAGSLHHYIEQHKKVERESALTLNLDSATLLPC